MRSLNIKVRDARYELLKNMLEDRRRDILDETSEVRDAEEQSVDDFIQDVDFTLMQMKAETLRKIDEALQRLDQGTYGICGDCGRELSAPRLRALPFAALCRECQEDQEERNAEAREARSTRTLEWRL
jgi:DnaK suppressor protein